MQWQRGEETSDDDPYVAAVRAALPEGWLLLGWGTDDG